MKITKFPEQKRTIIVKNSEPILIYLPPTIFIEYKHHLLLVFEYQNQWWSFERLLPNVIDSNICFGRDVQNTINGFWNSFFDQPYLGITKPNWWKNLPFTNAYNDLVKTIDDLEFIKKHISLLSDKGIANIAIGAICNDNDEILEYVLNNFHLSNMGFVLEVIKFEKHAIKICDYIDENYTKIDIISYINYLTVNSIVHHYNDAFKYLFHRYHRYHLDNIIYYLKCTLLANNDGLFRFIIEYMEKENIKLNLNETIDTLLCMEKTPINIAKIRTSIILDNSNAYVDDIIDKNNFNLNKLNNNFIEILTNLKRKTALVPYSPSKAFLE